MMTASASGVDERVDEAVRDLQHRIASRFPDAIFHLEPGESPDSVYLVATVDIDDTEEVIDVVIDRLVDLHGEDYVPVHLVVLRTPERVAAMLDAHHSDRAEAALLPG